MVRPAPDENSLKETVRTPSLAIIATKGTMDMAYPPFMATTAAALGWDTSIFFTLRTGTCEEGSRHQGPPLGNPAMPMKMPSAPNG
jgi:hypothetical protein